MHRIEVTAGQSPVEGHYQRIAVLERVLQNIGPTALPGARRYLESALEFHREAIAASPQGRAL